MRYICFLWLIQLGKNSSSYTVYSKYIVASDFINFQENCIDFTIISSEIICLHFLS